MALHHSTEENYQVNNYWYILIWIPALKRRYNTVANRYYFTGEIYNLSD